MKKYILTLLLMVGVSAGVRYNNDNFFSSPQPKPAWYYEDWQGNWWGETENGISFSQKNVVNDVTRLQRFQIEDAFWYISDKGTFFASDDLNALSIYLSI